MTERTSLRIVLASLAVIMVISVFAITREGRHECDAPCTVNFPGDTAEDDVRFDWTGHDARVWKQHVDE